MVWETLEARKPDQYYRRLYWVAVGVGLLLLVLAGRLVWMQVFHGAFFRDQALHNSIRIIAKRAPRGLLLDRNLKILGDNTPSLTLAVIPAELERKGPREKETVLERLADLSGRPLAEIKKKYKRQQGRPFAPVDIKQDISRKLAARIEEQREKLFGTVILEDSKRSYPVQTAAHVLGYVAEITDKQLSRLQPEGYRMGDLVGQTGVEKVYDQVLRGRDGGRQVKIDSAGRELGLLNEVPAIQGNNLVLTIDKKLQVLAENVLGRQAGAIVVLDPRNGEILALVSKPDYLLKNFSGGISPRQWRNIRRNKRHPMSNRAIQGLYPPGSIFKIVTAATGLKAGIVDVNKPKECLGIYWISTWPYRCWREIGHGYISMHRSIVESCDIYYYQLGLQAKVDRIHDMALDFGFGRKSGIDLPGESFGLVPSTQWKEKTQHMPWFPGNTVMMSIGQGYLLSTPIQLVMMVAAVANGGFVYRPHLLKKITASDGKTTKEIEPQMLRKVDLDVESFHVLREGMRGVVNERKGTGWRARVAGVEIAGKTGTSQNPHGEDHAGFVAFAPVDQPRIAIAVLVENGGEGGLTAAPMAQKILKSFFGR